MNKVLLSANNITIRLRDHFLFSNTSWHLNEGEQWVITGENGSGKTTFAKALCGLLPLKTGEIILHFVKDQYPYPQLHKDKIVYVSFDTQQQFLKRDSLKRDFESYVGIESPGTKVRDFISQEIRDKKQEIREKNFEISNLFDRDMITLSTGEMRKVFLVKALLQNPKILVLDEPFDGLDIVSKKILMEIISAVMQKGMHVMLIVHKSDQIPRGMTHIMSIKDGRIENLSSRAQTRELAINYKGLMINDENEISHIVGNDKSNKEVLVDFKNVTVKFGEKIILDNISWQLKDGENWAILGHNGAGKSTLLQLIIGDQLQKYANNITLFGKRGVSVWDIKKAIGIVSQDIFSKHVYDMKAESVILSGFFDSIGLYKNTTDAQKEKAKKWIRILGLGALVPKNFQELSYGQKRLILIARAVVKSPKILILDEPCHGLDSQNRQKVLETIDAIGNTDTNLLLVTHDPEEIVPSVSNVLELENGKIRKQIKI